MQAACWNAGTCVLYEGGDKSRACMRTAWRAVVAISVLGSPALCMQAACLEARNREPSAGANELALSLLDVLRAVGPAIAQAMPAQTQARLLRALCGALERAGGNAPLRLRAAAAATLGTLAGCAAFATAFVDAVGGAHLQSKMQSTLLRGRLLCFVLLGDVQLPLS